MRSGIRSFLEVVLQNFNEFKESISQKKFVSVVSLGKLISVVMALFYRDAQVKWSDSRSVHHSLVKSHVLSSVVLSIKCNTI